jgi:hypothetical protein
MNESKDKSPAKVFTIDLWKAIIIMVTAMLASAGGGGAYTMGTSYLNEFGFQPGSTNDITSTRYVYGSWVAENEL